MFLNKAGAYSINPGNRSSVKESLKYTLDLLQDSKNLVVFYPQGKFQSLTNPRVKFEKGAGYLIKRLKEKVHLVFYVALVDYFEHRKPSLSIYFHQVDPPLAAKNFELETHYNLFLADCIKKQSSAS
jgi:hypothetical protein